MTELSSIVENSLFQRWAELHKSLNPEASGRDCSRFAEEMLSRYPGARSSTAEEDHVAVMVPIGIEYHVGGNDPIRHRSRAWRLMDAYFRQFPPTQKGLRDTLDALRKIAQGDESIPETCPEYVKAAEDGELNPRPPVNLPQIQVAHPRDVDESAPYGYCPVCGEPGVFRERRPNGDDLCSNTHRYPSKTALPGGHLSHEKPRSGTIMAGAGSIGEIPQGEPTGGPIPERFQGLTRPGTHAVVFRSREAAEAQKRFAAAWEHFAGWCPETPPDHEGNLQWVADHMRLGHTFDVVADVLLEALAIATGDAPIPGEEGEK